MSDITGVSNLTSSSSGSTSLTGIQSAVSNLNTGKAETSVTVNGKALSTSPVVLGLASSDFANQGSTTTVLHGNAAGNPAFSAVVEADITLADNTTNNVSTSNHGFVKKLPNDATLFLDGTGNFSSVVNPTGSILMYGGSSAPTGYLLCDGSSLARTGTYAALFAAIGTAYGTADGSHFNVPDLRGRIPAGVGTGTGGGASGTGLPTGGTALTAVSLGTWKGEETHTLTVGELAAHTHDYSNSAGGGGGSGVVPAVAGGSSLGSGPSTGSGTAHNNIQPVMGLNFIIKT